MTKRPVRLEALESGCAQASRDPVKLRVMPRNRKGNGGVQQRAEVEGIVRILPKIVGVDQQELSKRLLKTGIELVPEARLNRHSGGAEDVLRQPADSGRAREQQILIKRSFESPRVGQPQNRAGLLDVVGDAHAR